jgi:hypothetical protein
MDHFDLDFSFNGHNAVMRHIAVEIGKKEHGLLTRRQNFAPAGR